MNETNIENYETDLHEKVCIQKTQEWPIHSFSFKLLDTLFDNLSLVIIKNNKYNSTPNTTSTSLVPIICETINLLIEILHETKSEWFNLNVVKTNIIILFIFSAIITLTKM